MESVMTEDYVFKARCFFAAMAVGFGVWIVIIQLVMWAWRAL
jgi:hypothetical protein